MMTMMMVMMTRRILAALQSLGRMQRHHHPQAAQVATPQQQQQRQQQSRCELLTCSSGAFTCRAMRFARPRQSCSKPPLAWMVSSVRCGHVLPVAPPVLRGEVTHWCPPTCVAARCLVAEGAGGSF